MRHADALDVIPSRRLHDKLFESALGISAPWSVQSVDFDSAAKRLTVLIDFTPGTRFGVAGDAGLRSQRNRGITDCRRGASLHAIPM